MDAKKFMAWTVGLYRDALNWLAPGIWCPKQAAVDEWLEYYKKSVWLKAKDFSTVMANAFGVAILSDSTGGVGGKARVIGLSGETEYPTREESERDYKDFMFAEDAFNKLEADRTRVGHEYLNGYEAARAGSERYCARFDRPSNSAYSWYNGWAVGEFDRLWREGKLCLLEEKNRLLARTRRLEAAAREKARQDAKVVSQ